MQPAISGNTIVWTDHRNGNWDIYMATIQGLNNPPSAEAGLDQTVNEGAELTFAGKFTDPDVGDAHTYEWDFGDNSPDTNTLSTTHTYADNGVYTAKLTVTDKNGASDSDTLTVTVQNVAPTVSIDSVIHQFTVIFPGEELQFNGSFTDPGWLDTHISLWSFGDSSTTSGSLVEENDPPLSSGTTEVNHSYLIPGDYEINLTIQDIDGDCGSSTQTIHIASETEMGAGINAYIVALPAEAFTKNPDKHKIAFSNKINQAIISIDSGNITDAINLLNAMRAQADGSLGGNPKNDVIIDPETQHEIYAMIDYLVSYLQS
jgi:beta propeller repeat protein